MNSASLNESVVLTNEIVDYYGQCWLNRFEAGHNPMSLAMHMGYFEDGTTDNDEAKVNMNRFLAQQLGLTSESDAIILDAGCGVGGTCFYLAERYAGISVIGLNLSVDQVRAANSFKEERSLLGKVDFVVGNYANTVFEKECFDIIYMIESLCHAEDKTVCYKEVERLLRPGGKLVILDYVQVKTELDPCAEAELKQFQDGWAVKQYILNPEKELTNVGFENVQLSSLTSQVRPGISLSAKRSASKLKVLNGHSGNTLMSGHFKACVALESLVAKRVVDYTLISAVKSKI